MTERLTPEQAAQALNEGKQVQFRFKQDFDSADGHIGDWTEWDDWLPEYTLGCGSTCQYRLRPLNITLSANSASQIYMLAQNQDLPISIVEELRALVHAIVSKTSFTVNSTST